MPLPNLGLNAAEVLLNDCSGDRSEQKSTLNHEYDDVIELTENGDEVRNDVYRQGKIADEQGSADAGSGGQAGVVE